MTINIIIAGDSTVAKSRLKPFPISRKSYDRGSKWNEINIMLEVPHKTLNSGFILALKKSFSFDIKTYPDVFNIKDERLQTADVAILAFDVTNKDSFNNIGKWRDEIVSARNKKQIPFLLVGDTSDLENRQVFTQEAADWAKEQKMLYIECSATKNINQEEMILEALLLIQKDLTPDEINYLKSQTPSALAEQETQKEQEKQKLEKYSDVAITIQACVRGFFSRQDNNTEITKLIKETKTVIEQLKINNRDSLAAQFKAARLETAIEHKRWGAIINLVDDHTLWRTPNDPNRTPEKNNTPEPPTKKQKTSHLPRPENK